MGAENGVLWARLQWIQEQKHPIQLSQGQKINQSSAKRKCLALRKAWVSMSESVFGSFSPPSLPSGCFTYHENPTEQSGHEFAQQSGAQAGDVNKRPLGEAGRWEEGAEFVFDSLRDVTTNHILSPDLSSIAQKTFSQ